MRKGSTRPSRAVIVLYAVMVTLTIAIAVISFIADYERTRQDIEERAEAYAISMATDVRWYVDVARQSLRRAADSIRRGRDPDDVVIDAISDLPDGVVVVLYDAQGTSQKVMGISSPVVNVADRQYFRELKDGKQWVISNLISDRITKKKTFAIGLALREGGLFKGAAVAYAPMEVFQDSWLSVGGANGNVFIVHRDGWITARLPPLDSEVYDHPVSQEFVNTFAQTPTGSTWAVASPVDGVKRVLGFAAVKSTPLIAVLGQSPDAQFAALRWRILVAFAILAPILVLLGYATFQIRNLLRRQEVTEDRLRSALATNKRFLLEIHHRVKNNLQSAQSLIRMYVKSPDVMAEIEPRIAAMAKVHEHIYRSDHLVSVAAGEYLRDIAQQVIFSSSRTIELLTDIEAIDLPSDVAMPVGQLLNEAIINAVKYGFDGRDEANICICLKMETDQRALLTIHNNGAPLPLDQKRGIGSRLMPAFAQQVNGTVETTSDDNGVTVTLKFPLDGKG